MTDPIDLAEIAALAKAAGGEEWHGRWEIGLRGTVTDDQGDEIAEGRTPAIAGHIARMDPATTLRLLEMIEGMHDAIAEVYGLGWDTWLAKRLAQPAEAPGIWVPRVVSRHFDNVPPDRAYFAVQSDRQLDRDRPECVGQPVMLDGQEWIITSVGHHALNGPIQPGEVIGLTVRRPTETLSPDTAGSPG